MSSLLAATVPDVGWGEVTLRLVVAAVLGGAVGVVDGTPVLDLDYSEDSNADTDMNVVMTGDGRLIEVQATAEKDPFTRELLGELLDLAERGCRLIGQKQADAVSRDL